MTDNTSKRLASALVAGAIALTACAPSADEPDRSEPDDGYNRERISVREGGSGVINIHVLTVRRDGRDCIVVHSSTGTGISCDWTAR